MNVGHLYIRLALSGYAACIKQGYTCYAKDIPSKASATLIILGTRPETWPTMDPIELMRLGLLSQLSHAPFFETYPAREKGTTERFLHSSGLEIPKDNYDVEPIEIQIGEGQPVLYQ